MQPNFFELPPESYKDKLPLPPSQLIPKLRSIRVQDYKGLFLKKELTPKSKQLTQELSKGLVTNWSNYTDLETLSSCLYNYFSTLSSYDPLIPLDVLTAIVIISATQDITKEKQTCKSIFEGYKNYSLSRYLLIAYLFDFLHLISENHNKNDMNSTKLATAFAPIISNTAANGEEKTINAIAFLIDEYDFIFPNLTQQFQDTSSSIYLTDKDIHQSFAPSIDYLQIKYQIAKASFRQDHVIRYLPKCQVSKSAKYKRPTRPPPPNPTSANLLTVNMLDSALYKIDQNDQSYKVLGAEKDKITRTIPNYDKLVKASSKPQKKPSGEQQKIQIKSTAPSQPRRTPARSKTLSSKAKVNLELDLKAEKVAQEAPDKKQIDKKLAKTDNDLKKGAAPAPTKKEPIVTGGGGSIADRINKMKMGGMPMGMPMGPMPHKRASSQIQNDDIVIPGAGPAIPAKNEETPIDVVPEDTGVIITRAARGPARRRPAALQDI